MTIEKKKKRSGKINIYNKNIVLEVFYDYLLSIYLCFHAVFAPVWPLYHSDDDTFIDLLRHFCPFFHSPPGSFRALSCSCVVSPVVVSQSLCHLYGQNFFNFSSKVVSINGTDRTGGWTFVLIETQFSVFYSTRSVSYHVEEVWYKIRLC